MLSATAKKNIRKAKKARRPSKNLREKVFARDKYRCVVCGSTENLTIDHRIPYSKGGTTEMSNLQTLCESCNQKKADSSLTYADAWNRLKAKKTY